VEHGFVIQLVYQPVELVLGLTQVPVGRKKAAGDANLD
jgi:hypothetical protein